MFLPKSCIIGKLILISKQHTIETSEQQFSILYVMQSKRDII